MKKVLLGVSLLVSVSVVKEVIRNNFKTCFVGDQVHTVDVKDSSSAFYYVCADKKLFFLAPGGLAYTEKSCKCGNKYIEVEEG